jgi:hypothetical protein
MSHPVRTAVVRVRPCTWIIWCRKMPTKPIAASIGHARAGGMNDSRLTVRMMTSTATPSPNRVKMSVTGETSRSAAFVATKETPQRTMAVKAASLAAADWVTVLGTSLSA